MQLRHYPVSRSGILALTLVLPLASCSIELDGGTTSRTIIRSSGEYRAQWSSGSHELSVESKGAVTFNDAETDVLSLEPKGRFELLEDRDGIEREYRVTADSSGTLTRTYRVDGKLKPEDASVEQWRTDALQRLFRESGYDAQGHVKRLIARGGAELVFEEVELSTNDFTRAQLLRALISDEELAADNLERAITAAGSIDSDFELANTLRAALIHFPASDGVHTEWIRVARGIDSDFELARTFTEAAELRDMSAGFHVELLEAAARSIDSDFELGRVLAASAPQARDPKVAGAALTALSAIDSDFECGRSLKAYAPFVAAIPELHERYRAIARELGEFERGRALIALDEAMAR